MTHPADFPLNMAQQSNRGDNAGRRPPLVVVLVGLTPPLQRAAEQAVRTLWPRVELDITDAANALARPAVVGRELVMAGDVSPAETTALARARNADGITRWPVVSTAAISSEPTIWPLPANQWNSPELPRVLELANAQHETMREAERARGDLLTIARRVNHEIRSPLGSILTAAEVLIDVLKDTAPDLVEMVHPITDSGHELLRLVDQLTFLARASASNSPMEPVDLGLVTWTAQQRVAAEVQRVGATLEVPDNWPFVLGVGDWIERMWVTLVGNALRHAGPQPRVELGCEINDDHVRCFVRDHGTGVAPEQVTRLFRPFHQLHQSDSGRGLGLAVVQRLTELQEGTCGYEPVRPHGSLFFFTLPLATLKRSR